MNGDMGPDYCLDFVSYPITYLGGRLVSPLYYIYYIYLYIYIQYTWNPNEMPLVLVGVSASFWGAQKDQAGDF